MLLGASVLAGSILITPYFILDVPQQPSALELSQQREQELDRELEESRRELIRLRAQNQANEVRAQSNLRDASDEVKRHAQELKDQESRNLLATQQAAIDQAVSNALLKAQLSAAKEEAKKNSYVVLGGQLITFASVIAHYFFTAYREKLHHAWAIQVSARQQATEDRVEHKLIAVDSKMQEVNEILNNERLPRRSWLDRETGLDRAGETSGT